MADSNNMIERLPPQSQDAEMAVLGSMLLSPEAVSRSVEIISDEENFYSSAHRKIFRGIINLYEKMFYTYIEIYVAPMAGQI